jgi:hypothetical protein
MDIILVMYKTYMVFKIVFYDIHTSSPYIIPGYKPKTSLEFLGRTNSPTFPYISPLFEDLPNGSEVISGGHRQRTTLNESGKHSWSDLWFIARN